MKRTRISRLLSLTALAVIVAVFSSSAIWAQGCPPNTGGTTPPWCDVLKVNYFSGANTTNPGATVYISNPGTSWGAAAPGGTPGGNLCAMIYVVDPSQEVLECCGCSLTPDSLRTLDVNLDLTSNSLTGGPLVGNGSIKIISTNGYPTCNPGLVGKGVNPTPTVRAWGTHIQNTPNWGPPPFSVTEADFQDATLSIGEETHLAGICRSIMSNGSGHGVCTCGTGD